MDSIFFESDFKDKLKKWFKDLLRMQQRKKVPLNEIGSILDEMGTLYSNTYKTELIKIFSKEFPVFAETYINLKRWHLRDDLAGIEKIRVKFEEPRESAMIDVLVDLGA